MRKLFSTLTLISLLCFSHLHADEPSLPAGFDYVVRIKGNALFFELEDCYLYRAEIIETRVGAHLKGEINIRLDRPAQVGQLVACMHIYEKLLKFKIRYFLGDRESEMIDAEKRFPYEEDEEDILVLKILEEDKEKIIYSWIAPYYVGILLPLRRRGK